MSNFEENERLLKERKSKLSPEGKKELRRLYRTWGKGFVDLYLLCGLDQERRHS